MVDIRKEEFWISLFVKRMRYFHAVLLGTMDTDTTRSTEAVLILQTVSTG